MRSKLLVEFEEEHKLTEVAQALIGQYGIKVYSTEFGAYEPPNDESYPYARLGVVIGTPDFRFYRSFEKISGRDYFTVVFADGRGGRYSLLADDYYTGRKFFIWPGYHPKVALDDDFEKKVNSLSDLIGV